MNSTPTPDFARELTIPPLEWHRRMREWFQFMRHTEPVKASLMVGSPALLSMGN